MNLAEPDGVWGNSGSITIQDCDRRGIWIQFLIGAGDFDTILYRNSLKYRFS
jgi:hypothetical protein